MAAMGFPPGMDQLVAQMALTNPSALAAMAAAKGIMPPPVPSPTAGVRDQATGAFNMAQTQPTGVPSPAAATAAMVAPAAQTGIGALAAPSTEGGAGRSPWPPQPPQPGGALATQMPQILQLLMGGAPPPAPSLGSLIMGGGR